MLMTQVKKREKKVRCEKFRKVVKRLVNMRVTRQ